MSELALSVRGLRKRYGRTEALRSLDLDVRHGEIVALVGPNGAGKSTLTKAVCGLIKPSGGVVEVMGHPAGAAAARALLGYLPETFRFPGWCTGDDVLALHQGLARSGGGAQERAELLELVGLGAVRDRRVGEMSRGMQQRLGIAQALVGSPRLVLLDEPTSALDPAGRRAVRKLLEELGRRGVAILLSSHLLSEVELVADRVVFLTAGKIVRSGSPTELATERAVEVETDEGPLRFPGAGREDVPRILAQLIENGARVYGVRATSASLEEVYLEAVGDQVS